LQKNFNKKLPLISVVMNCHNGQAFLKESIKSLTSQTYKNWELIFWDNNSTDKSEEILKQFNDRRIKYFKSDSYLKLYRARNLAINQTKGEFVTFLDTDDLWNNKKLEKQLEICEKNKNIKFVYSNFFILNQNSNKLFKRSNKKLASGEITQLLLNDYVIGILTVMIKKDIFSHYKFDEKYEIIGDFDFFIKLSQKFKLDCIQEPLATYRIHDSNFSLKRIDNHVKELEQWMDINHNKLTKSGYSLIKQKTYLLKLRIKSFFKNLI
jgi:glycosyltransferase involved in cell wall biosynthesis